jgi:hypothetical protein
MGMTFGVSISGVESPGPGSLSFFLLFSVLFSVSLISDLKR